MYKTIDKNRLHNDRGGAHTFCLNNAKPIVSALKVCKICADYRCNLCARGVKSNLVHTGTCVFHCVNFASEVQGSDLSVDYASMSVTKLSCFVFYFPPRIIKI